MTRQLQIYVIALCLIAVGASSCAEKKGDADYSDNIFTEARFIRGHALPDSSVIISVVNPWDTTALLAQYRLVNAPDTTTVPGLPTLRLPLQRMVVYSSVHAGLLAESGQIDRIAGVADAQYITDDSIRARIADGRIVDIGSSMEPSLEKIVALRPDAILISPFKDAGHGVADRTGIPVIECADYMELSPMGRMEWTRFYSMLAEGMGRENDRMFRSVKARYDSLCSVASRFDKTPLVLTEMPEKGVSRDDDLPPVGNHRPAGVAAFGHAGGYHHAGLARRGASAERPPALVGCRPCRDVQAFYGSRNRPGLFRA